MKKFKVITALLTFAALSTAAAVPAFADTETVAEVNLNPGANTVMFDEFSDGEVPSYVKLEGAGAATVENGMLKLEDGAQLENIRIPKNSAIEFDIKSTTDKETGTLVIDTRRDKTNQSNYYQITYQSLLGGDNNYYGRFLAYAGGADGRWDELVGPKKATLQNYVIRNTETTHVKYVTYEDRLAIFCNGRLAAVCTEQETNQDGGIYKMYAMYKDPDKKGAIYIDNLKITKADLTDARNVYVTSIIENQDFSGDKMDYFSDHIQENGKLKLVTSNDGPYFGAGGRLKVPSKNAFVEFDLEVIKNAGTDADNPYSTFAFQYGGKYTVKFKYLAYTKPTLQVTVAEKGASNLCTNVNVYQSNGKVRVRIQTDEQGVSTLFVSGQRVVKWDNKDTSDSLKLVGYIESQSKADTYIDNFLSGTGLPESAITDCYKPEELTVYDGDGWVVTTPDKVKNGNYTVRTHITNTTDAAKEAVICVGIYDSNGSLAGAAMQPITVEAGAFDKAIEVPFQIENVSDQPIVKAFMFDSMGTIQPIIANTVIF